MSRWGGSISRSPTGSSLFCACLAALLASAPVQARAVEVEAGLFFASLSKRAYADQVDVSRFFEDGYGLDLAVLKNLGETLSVAAGANTVFFDGKEGGTTAARVGPDRIAAHALFAGVRLSPRPEKGWTVYGRFDAGLSILEDVRHDVARGGTDLGTETSLKGGQDLYLGFGAGLAFKVDDRWDITFGWESRRYGRFAGLEDPAVQQVPTRDLPVVASGVRLAATYRF